jgi:hypothetical protein
MRHFSGDALLDGTTLRAWRFLHLDLGWTLCGTAKAERALGMNASGLPSGYRRAALFTVKRRGAGFAMVALM